MLNAVKGDLQNQIDGKIETYYQSSNPWNSWPSGTEPDHVGDLWYNTSTKELKSYVGPSSNTWAIIRDQAAIDAAEAASRAQDTADGKRRVFLSTPYPPYDAGDQWITYGSDGSSMRVCVQGRQSGRYVSSDWQLSDADGNVKVSIDRGVVSATGIFGFGPAGTMRTMPRSRSTRTEASTAKGKSTSPMTMAKGWLVFPVMAPLVTPSGFGQGNQRRMRNSRSTRMGTPISEDSVWKAEGCFPTTNILGCPIPNFSSIPMGQAPF